MKNCLITLHMLLTIPQVTFWLLHSWLIDFFKFIQILLMLKNASTWVCILFMHSFSTSSRTCSIKWHFTLSRDTLSCPISFEFTTLQSIMMIFKLYFFTRFSVTKASALNALNFISLANLITIFTFLGFSLSIIAYLTCATLLRLYIKSFSLTCLFYTSSAMQLDCFSLSLFVFNLIVDFTL